MTSFKRVEGINYPAQEAEAITLDALMDNPARALYIGATGNLKVMMLNNAVVTFTNVAAGYVLPVSVKKIFSSGTTIASPTTNILALR